MGNPCGRSCIVGFRELKLSQEPVRPLSSAPASTAPRSNHPLLCDCGARYLIAETSVSQAFDSAEKVAGDAGFVRQAKANLMCELYVILGAFDAPTAVLDQVFAAVEDEELPYSTLIPFENDK